MNHQGPQQQVPFTDTCCVSLAPFYTVTRGNQRQIMIASASRTVSCSYIEPNNISASVLIPHLVQNLWLTQSLGLIISWVIIFIMSQPRPHPCLGPLRTLSQLQGQWFYVSFFSSASHHGVTRLDSALSVHQALWPTSRLSVSASQANCFHPFSLLNTHTHTHMHACTRRWRQTS